MLDRRYIVVLVLSISVLSLNLYGCSHADNNSSVETSIVYVYAEPNENASDESNPSHAATNDDPNLTITKLPSVEEFLSTSIELGYILNNEPPYTDNELSFSEDHASAIRIKKGYPDRYNLDIFDSTEDANDRFNIELTKIKADEYDEILQGALKYEDNDDNGYILFDATHRKGISGQFIGENPAHEYAFYGGIFYCGNKYMEIYSFSVDEELKKSEKDKIDEIMQSYNLPPPRHSIFEMTGGQKADQVNETNYSEASYDLNIYYDFPDWYEMDKTVVYKNMVCYARDFINYDGVKIPQIWLWVFDENDYFVNEYAWVLCPDEETAISIEKWDSNCEKYRDGNIIAYNNHTIEMDVILNVTGLKSYHEVTKQDVIGYNDGTLWGSEPGCEVIYK